MDFYVHSQTRTMTFDIVNSPLLMVSLLDQIEDQPSYPPSLYLDIEGIALSRHGSISIIQLLCLPQTHVFLINIHVLPGNGIQYIQWIRHQLSLDPGVLIDPQSVFSDVRNDADALFAHFNVSLRGVHDIQLLEIATRDRGPKDQLLGLAGCVQNNAALTDEAQEQWQVTQRLWEGVVQSAARWGV